MYCRTCGRAIQDNDPFCKYCGSKQWNDYSMQGSHRRRIRFRADTFGLLLFTVVILVTLYRFFPNIVPSFKSDEQQAEEIVEDFFDAVKSGDVSGAIECFTPAFQEQYSGTLSASGTVLSVFGLPNVTNLVNPYIGYVNQKYYQNYEFKVQNVRLNTDKKSGSVEVYVYVDGQYNQSTTINVTKYKGKWYIEN